MDQKLDCITVIEKTSWLKRRFQLMIVFAAKFTMGLHLDKKKRTERSHYSQNKHYKSPAKGRAKSS